MDTLNGNLTEKFSLINEFWIEFRFHGKIPFLLGKRKRKAAENVKKRMKTDWDELGSSSEEEEKNNESDYENEDLDNDSDDDVQSDDYDPNNRYSTYIEI